jgi:hypothetical protein
MTLFLTLLVCLVGLLMYLLSNQNAKAMRIGEIMFFCGLLVSLFNLAPEVVKLWPTTH